MSTTAAERAAEKIWATSLTESCVPAIATIIAKEYEPMIRALEQLAECDLNDDNCASLEVATKRIRNIARGALRQELGR